MGAEVGEVQCGGRFIPGYLGVHMDTVGVVVPEDDGELELQVVWVRVGGEVECLVGWLVCWHHVTHQREGELLV